MERLTEKEQKAIDAFLRSVEYVEREDPTAQELTDEEEIACQKKRQ